MEQVKRSQSPFHSGTLLLGVLLFAAGVIFLLDNFDVIYIGVPATRFWPLIVVAVGLSKYLQADSAYERRRGFWWIFIGLWLLVSVLHMFGLSFHTSWPLLLIGLGINAIWKAVSPPTGYRLS